MEKRLKIMVPVDFTPVSMKALEFLKLLLDKSTVEAHLVHVIQVNTAEWTGGTESSETIDRAEIRGLEEKAARQFEELGQQAGFAFTSSVLHGGLTTSLAGYATQIQADLVIMGTEGAEGWFEKLSGSEAQHVVRQSAIPVITIHQHALLSPVRNILWVADFEGEQQPAGPVQGILALQQLFGARLHLLQILKKEDEAQTKAIKAAMQKFADRQQLENYEIHLHHDAKVQAGVQQFNREAEMDLVCIGTHARKGLNHIFFGSVAETLVNQCIRPLLSYHLA